MIVAVLAQAIATHLWRISYHFRLLQYSVGTFIHQFRVLQSFVSNAMASMSIKRPPFASFGVWVALTDHNLSKHVYKYYIYKYDIC